VLQGVAVCCSELQGVAVCCNVLQCVAVYRMCVAMCVAVCCSVLLCVVTWMFVEYMHMPGETVFLAMKLGSTATHCNTLQHTATHCTTLQHTASHCTTLHHTATRRGGSVSGNGIRIHTNRHRSSGTQEPTFAICS